MAVSAGRVFQSIQRKLTEALKPVSLAVKARCALFQRQSLSAQPPSSAVTFLQPTTVTPDASFPLSASFQNESHLHAGHSGNPSGAEDAETHFRVEVVSDAFSGKPTVARHRAVYKLLEQEIAEGVHALSLRTLAPGEK